MKVSLTARPRVSKPDVDPASPKTGPLGSRGFEQPTTRPRTTTGEQHSFSALKAVETNAIHSSSPAHPETLQLRAEARTARGLQERDERVESARTIQRWPLAQGSEKAEPFALRGYGDIIYFLEEGSDLSNEFEDLFAHRFDWEDIIEEFLADNSDQYSGAQGREQLVIDIQEFLDGEGEVEDFLDEWDEYDEIGETYMASRVRGQDKASRKKTRKQEKNEKATKPVLTKEQKILADFAGMTGDESTKDLNPIESIHEGIFSNLYQGGKLSDFHRKRGGPNLKDLRVARRYLEGKENNYKSQLEKTRKEIIEGTFLVRKMSHGEAKSFRESGEDKDAIFPKGTEGMKAFAIDGVYTFSDSERNKQEGAYDIVMKVILTPRLKTYLINFLSANVKNPLGVQEKEMQFTFNPQFKFEGGGVTVLIPPTGWKAFWSFVGKDVVFLRG